MNEIEKESEKNPQVKANIKLMISKDLKEDVLKKNVFDNGRLAEKRLSLEHLFFSFPYMIFMQIFQYSLYLSIKQRQ